MKQGLLQRWKQPSDDVKKSLDTSGDSNYVMKSRIESRQSNKNKMKSWKAFFVFCVIKRETEQQLNMWRITPSLITLWNFSC